ncbi:hypothetical protein OAK06_04025 [Gammaproteobacteria bacterium]|nr:hypothetical protein [Gammaproteobacteria bacterium]
MSDDLTKKIVICDIDGTIANNDHRQHLLEGFKDWDKFFDQMSLDKPINPVINLVKKMQKEGNEIAFLTGRPERYRPNTTKWLKKYFYFNFSLTMRKDDDTRNKLEIKNELFQENFSSSQIECCLENDLSLVKLWKELGLRVIDANKVGLKS